MVKGLFVFLFLSVGLFITYAIVWSGYRQNDAHNRFQQVTAHVVSSRVTSSSSGSGSNRTTSYQPVITYRYTVEGHEYESKQYHFFGRGHSTWESADQVASAYPVGKEITAYYDPDDPSVAVLDRSPVNMTLIYTGAAIFWGVVAGLIAFFAVRQWTRGNAEPTLAET